MLQLLEKVMGHAAFSYQGIKLLLGPYGLLDNFMLRDININPYVTSALTQYLSNGGIFLDVGANHGVLSLLAAKNPKIQVFAFEPSMRELNRLWKNLMLNEQLRVNVLSYGLGNENKTQAFVLSPSDNPGKNSLPAICEKGTHVTCPFIKLTDLFSRDLLKQVRLCKLDVEGQEMLILNSLKDEMSHLQTCVFVIEMHQPFLSKIGFKPDDIYAFFKNAGFKYQFGKPDHYEQWEGQWEEFFYHPTYNQPLTLNE